eukprot:644572-Pleurochrysis_carterae.AAC.3
METGCAATDGQPVPYRVRVSQHDRCGVDRRPLCRRSPAAHGSRRLPLAGVRLGGMRPAQNSTYA